MDKKSYTFKTKDCEICGNEISIGGAAYTSHMRMHVRKQEAVEFKRGKKLLFIPVDSLSSLIEEYPFAKLAEDPLPGQPKGVWDMTEALTNLEVLDPNSYFVTSGEAVKKGEKLVKDAYSLAVKCRSFLNKLKKCRGKKKFLETAREDGRLLVKGKDPRSKGSEYD
jgi:hypothetical protein